MRSPAVYVMIMMKIKEVTLCTLKASSPKVIYFEHQGYNTLFSLEELRRRVENCTYLKSGCLDKA